MLKKIDRLLLKGFWSPLLLAFGLVMFVFTMQSMWKFVDDIIGKGASLGMIIEFVLYLSVRLIPLSLPAAILLSSLYLMGNMAERYELTAMKSAGVSLWRIMRSLLLASIGIAVFSFICSNYIAPRANLKFYARLMSFKSQKLALSLNEGVFNDDFKNYSIRIAEKEEETNTIRDILLYDHSSDNRNRTKIIMAEDGYMDSETDDRYLIMRFNEGQQYQEMEESGPKGEPRSYPYMRIRFGKLDKYMDLAEFEMKETDEEMFKDQERMLSLRQLIFEMDTMGQKIAERKAYAQRLIDSYFFFVKNSDSTAYYHPLSEPLPDSDKAPRPPKRSAEYRPAKDRQRSTPSRRPAPILQRPGAPAVKPSPKPKPPIRKPQEREDKVIRQKLRGEPETFREIFLPQHFNSVLSRATSAAKTISHKATSTDKKLKTLKNKQGRYAFQAHLKFSLAVACIVFLLIGAPLGAITRKGGFGYPVLIGTVFFMLFVVLVTMCEKMFQTGTISSPALAAWLPVMIYAIPCFFITRGAVRDAKAMNIEFMEAWFRRLWNRKQAEPQR